MSKRNQQRTPNTPATPPADLSPAVDSTPSTQGDTPLSPTGDTPAETPAPAAPTKAQALMAARKIARDAKAAEKAATKAANLARRADGVIGTISTMLAAPQGATKRAIIDALAAKFPDRDRDGMAVTTGIQLSRLGKKRPVTSYKHADASRVYGYADVLVIPVVTAEGTTPAAPAEAAPTE